jgi:hypothetical protein
MDEFLRVEYEQCIALIKYYDAKELSLVKFAAAVSSAVLSVVVGLSGVGGGGQAEATWGLIGLLSGVTALGLLAIFVAMVQYRLYFIYPARQANAIRATSAEGFGRNQMYVSTRVSAFKFRSTHSVMSAFICLEIGAFAGLFGFSTSAWLREGVIGLVGTLGVGFVGAVLPYWLAMRYLVAKSAMTADEAVHGVGGS